MKKGVLLFILFQIVAMGGLIAQVTPAERLVAYKIAFLTRRLNLTVEESQRFWPVYNELQDKKNAIQRERASIFIKIAENKMNMSEKDIIEAGDRLISLDIQDANLSAEYHKRFKEILPPVKVVRLYQAENQYRNLLLNELRNAPGGLREEIKQRRER